MKFSVKRDQSYLNNLKHTLESNYDLTIKEIKEASRGVDGETWIVITKQGKLFVKIDYSANNTKKFFESLKAIKYLNEQGINYVNEIVLTNKKKLSIKFNGRTLALFKFLDGQIDYNFPYLKLMKLLIPIYQLKPSKSKIRKENFKINKLIKDLTKKIELAKKDEKLKEVLDNYKIQIAQYIASLQNYRKKINKRGLKVITHSDACVNVMVGEKISLIDWDDAMIAPLERDCWFFMDYSHKIKNINNLLKKNNIQYQISYDMLGFYAYKSALIYLNDDLDKYLTLKDEEILKDISDIFEGWVSKKIEGLNAKVSSK